MLSWFKKKMSKSTQVETSKSNVPVADMPLPITYEEISLRAYQHWLARGGTHGYDHEDWFKAELELTAVK